MQCTYDAVGPPLPVMENVFLSSLSIMILPNGIDFQELFKNNFYI